MNDVSLRAVVGIQAFYLNFAIVFFVQIIQQMPVAVAPAIDALLHIAHNKTACLVSDAVVEQNLKVRPLDGTCVLKLVNHDVTQLSSYLFINERRVLLVNQRVQKFLRVTKRIQAVGFINVLHLFFYPPQKP